MLTSCKEINSIDSTVNKGQNSAKKNLLCLVLVLSALVIVTLIMWATDVDLRIARFLYPKGGVLAGQYRWPGWNVFPWQPIYDFASLPAFILLGFAVLIFLGSFIIRSLKNCRKSALFLVLLLAIGPGLIVNVMFKEHYGRARPRELVEFGGKYQYTNIWMKGEARKNSSFPSGHASIGFYLIAPWFLLRRRKPVQATCWLASGIGLGLLIGLARILQGGHFLSDVLWAGGMVYITGEVLYYFIFSWKSQEKTKPLHPEPLEG